MRQEGGVAGQDGHVICDLAWKCCDRKYLLKCTFLF